MRPIGSRAVWHGGAAAAVAAAVLAGAAAVQPQPASTAPAAKATTEASEAAAMRDRLDQRAKGLETRAATLREALKKLDAGESPDEVRRFLETGSTFARLMGDPGAAIDARVIDPERPGPPPEGQGRPRTGVGRQRGPDERRAGPHPDDGRRGDGPPRGDRPPPPGPPDRPRLSPEEREVVIEILRHTSPEKVPDDIERDEPDKMLRLGFLARPMLEMKKRDPEGYRLKLERMKHESRAVSLAGSIAKRTVPVAIEPEKVAEFRKELREVAGRVFDVRIAEQAHELAQLQERLDQIREEIASQESRREALIDEQIEKLMKAAMQWAEEKAKGLPRDDGGMPPPGRIGREPREGAVPVSAPPR